MSSMLSQVQERRDVAMADFYKKPPVKRKHEEQDASTGEPSPSMPAAKLAKQEKPTGVRGLVSWAENSSLPSKSMVMSAIAAHTYPEACLLLLTALKEYFELGLTSTRLSATSSSHTIPGRSRVEELMAEFMKPFTTPGCPMEKAIRRLPPTAADITMFQQIHPIHEAQFCTALVKVFLTLGESGADVADAEEKMSSAAGSPLLASSVAWCLLDVVLTPIASSAVVVERISRIASLSLSLQCPTLLCALSSWMTCYQQHICKPSKSAGGGSKTGGSDAQQQQQQSIATRVVSQLLNDFCVLTLYDVKTLSSLPELSIDMAAVFLLEYAELNPVVERRAASTGAATVEVTLPNYNLLAMFADWLSAWPSLSVTVVQTEPPAQLPLSREWPAKRSTATSSSSSSPATDRQLCPLQGLISLSVCGPLACQYAVAVAAGSTEKTASVPSTAGVTASLQPRYEDSLAQLHGQLLLAMSLHKTAAGSAADGNATAAGTGRDSKARASPSPPPPTTQLLPADCLLAVVQRCHDLWKFAISKGVDVERVMSVSVDHLAQLIQVMSTAGITTLSKDHLKTIRNSLPSNQLLETVLQFLASHCSS